MTIEEADQALLKGSPVKIKGDGGVWIIQATNALNQTAELVNQTKQYQVEEALKNLSFWLGGEHGEPK
ncbi:hypothetical protein [Lactobacillus sp. 3B(2020)]|uniref:hypothetical protein n=1 Tax=Lactobacillus sp. 3B(2020) TaxID=2695882 RepID=UPI0015DF8BC6|nr:hypothetical protein [Lactobacillus sp. 3B(2020)]QLL70240.1 hypothetical protein GTO83_06675 [Lactobacillus sp. 3B(2020)]